MEKDRGLPPQIETFTLEEDRRHTFAGVWKVKMALSLRSSISE